MHRILLIAFFASMTCVYSADKESSSIPILIRPAEKSHLLLNGNLCTVEIARDRLAALMSRYGQQPVVVMGTSDMSVEQAFALAQVATTSHKEVYITFIGAGKTMPLLKVPHDENALALKRALDSTYIREAKSKPAVPALPIIIDQKPNRARDGLIQNVESIQKGVLPNSLPAK